MSARRRLLVLASLMLTGVTGRSLAQPPAGQPQDLFHDDVHARAGLGCQSCHTGAPPYGPIDRTRVAPLCATCHSSAEYMKKYNPQVRVDQYQEYLTSTHGKKMAAGDRTLYPWFFATAEQDEILSRILHAASTKEELHADLRL